MTNKQDITLKVLLTLALILIIAGLLSDEHWRPLLLSALVLNFISGICIAWWPRSKDD